MPKKYSRRNMRGGFDFNSITNSLSSGWNSLSQNSKSWWEKLKSPTTSSTGSSYGSGSTGSNYGSGSTGTTSYGGRKRRHRSKKMRGGNFTDNTPTTGLAFHAAPFSGETARPNTWVGGKTRKRRRRVKSCQKH